MADHIIIVRDDLTNLETFIAKIQSPNVTVNSLAILIDGAALHEHWYNSNNTTDASEITQTLWTLLENLSSHLPRLTTLQVFSLQVQDGRNNFWLPRPLLTSLLSHLPPTCTTVEIDTSGSDYCGEQPADTTATPIHLCDTISALLPRLTHLRLRLSTVCAKALTPSANQQFPNLTTLTVSCLLPGYTSRLCGSYKEEPTHSAFSLGSEAMPHLVQQMQTLVRNQCPQISHASVYDQNPKDDEDPASRPSYNCRDVLRDTVTAMPMIKLLAFEKDRDGNMLRAPGGDVFGTLDAFRAFLEAEVSRERALPRDREQLKLLSLEEWRAKYPRRSCAVWSAEKMVGRRLIEATKEAGAASRVVLVEETPEGWQREELTGDLYQE